MIKDFLSDKFHGKIEPNKLIQKGRFHMKYSHINHLIDRILTENIYNQEAVKTLNKKLNIKIDKQLKMETKKNIKDILHRIKVLTDQLAVMTDVTVYADAARFISLSRQFSEIQNELSKLQQELKGYKFK